MNRPVLFQRSLKRLHCSWLSETVHQTYFELSLYLNDPLLTDLGIGFHFLEPNLSISKISLIQIESDSLVVWLFCFVLAVRLLSGLLEKWFSYKIRRFWMIFNFFKFFQLSVPEKLKNTFFKVSIIPDILNINKYRTTSPTSISLKIIRKLIEYSLKKNMRR